MTVKELFKKFDKYVTVDRFSPIEKIVYGGVGLILTAFLAALIGLVLTR